MKISEFQQMMKDLYFERDKKRGVSRTFCWLVEEIGELAKGINKNIDIDQEFADAEEFADIFAWLCSLANLFEIDLEKVATDKYNNCCPKCKENPCKCEFV
ncbi:MAG: MazG nucleotide pyrophosphohydrolase domain-containing protein [Candidatus Hodarchaeota archaeon]